MFLRKTQRKKDGKTHDYWSVVENKRVAGGGVVQRHVLVLGRDQLLAGGRVAKGHRGSRRRCGASADTGAVPRRSMCCGGVRRVDRSASLVGHAAVSAAAMGRLLAGRAVVAGSAVGAVLGRAPAAEPQGYALGSGLACAGLVSIDRTGQRVEVAPRLVRQERHGRPVGGGLRTGGGAQAYACHDFLLQHKDALFSHRTARWCDLFNTNFDVLLYDLTSTYFEINASDVAEGDKRHHGYSRDKRPDCPQVVIALVVTPEGLPFGL